MHAGISKQNSNLILMVLCANTLNIPKNTDRLANSADTDQTAPVNKVV